VVDFIKETQFPLAGAAQALLLKANLYTHFITKVLLWEGDLSHDEAHSRQANESEKIYCSWLLKA